MAARYEVEIGFGGCDPAQLVFYPNYFRWFDAACWSLLIGLGLTRDAMNQRYGIMGTPLVEAKITFAAPARDGDRLVIESWVPRVGRRSFDVVHRALKDGAVVAEGQEVRVWTAQDPADPTLLTGRDIPDDVRPLLGGVTAPADVSP